MDKCPRISRTSIGWVSSLVICVLLMALGLLIWDGLFDAPAYGVVSGRIVKAASQTDGQVHQIHVRVGDVVLQNQLLVSLKFPELEKRLARIQDELRVARTDVRTEMALPEKQRRVRQQISRVKLLENEFARVGRLIKQGELRAPVDGRIVRLHCLPGDVAKSAVPIVHILEGNTLEAVLYVSQASARHINIGKTATISADVTGSILHCRIDRIAPELRLPPACISNYYPKNAKLVEVHAVIFTGDAETQIPLGSTVRFLEFEREENHERREPSSQTASATDAATPI